MLTSELRSLNQLGSLKSMNPPCSRGNRTRASASLCTRDPENMNLLRIILAYLSSYQQCCILGGWVAGEDTFYSVNRFSITIQTLAQFNWINYFERLSHLAKQSLRDTCDAELCLVNILKTQQGEAIGASAWQILQRSKYVCSTN